VYGVNLGICFSFTSAYEIRMKPENVLHIYLRVSTELQALDGFGIDAQKNVGLEIAQRNGFDVEIHEEGAASSSKEGLSNRPVMGRLLQRVQDGEIRKLFAFNADRLSRNDVTSATIRFALKENGVALYHATGVVDFNNPTDKLLFGVMSEFASYENELRTNRFRRGRLEAVKRGRWHGGQSPFGYRVSDHKLEEFEDESKWVRQIYQWYDDGKKIDEIRTELMSRGVRTRRGNSNWSYNGVRLLLSNSTYDGVRSFKDSGLGETVMSDCPRLVDPILSKRVKDKIAEIHLNAKPNAKKYPTLLRDMMVCGNCGGRIGQRIVPSQHTRLYACKTNERRFREDPSKQVVCSALDGSRIRSARQDIADRVVWASVVKTLRNSSLYKEHFKQIKMGNSVARDIGDEKSLKGKLKRLDKDMVSLRKIQTEQKILKEIGGDDYADTVTKVILDKEAERAQVLLDLGTFRQEKKWVDWVGDFEKHIHHLVNGEWSVEDKQRFLNAVIDRISMVCVDKTTHRFDIEFTLPYDGSEISYKSGHAGPYDIIMGKKTVSVELPDAASGSKKKIEE
jgi:site-specific DNA recombinase